MNTSFLKIISLNIELDKHLDRIIPFLKKQNPDVILLQEVLEKDIPTLEESTGMKGIFATKKILCFDEFESAFGILTLSRSTPIRQECFYYRGDGSHLARSRLGHPGTTARPILITELDYHGQIYRVANTHFTWTPDAKPSPDQHQDLKVLLAHLSRIPEFILMGDFNAPRGGIIFNTIAARYLDNIPPTVTTTIDKNIHRAGDLNLVVDGLFTTPGYRAESVEVISNLSDHCAIVARIVCQK